MRIIVPLLLILSFSAYGQAPVWTLPLDGTPMAPTFYPTAEAPDSIVVAGGNALLRASADGSAQWTVDVGAAVAAPPAVADLDGDGAADIVVMTGDGSFVRFDGDGTARWRAVFDKPAGGYKHVALGDVHPEPGLEIVAGFDDGYLRCLSAEGAELWRFCGAPYRVSPAAIGDATGDGAADIVYGTDDGQVYCLDGLGRIQWVHIENAPFGRSGPVIAPIGGKPAVLLTRSNVGNATCLLALDGATGGELWRTEDYMQGYVSTAAADMDGDGSLEFLHADKGNTVYCERSDGTRLWERRFMARGFYFAPAVADIDGDGVLEAVFVSRDTDIDDRAMVFVIDATGAVEHRLALAANGNVSAAPAIGDLDGDGVIEVYIPTSGPNAIQCLVFGGQGSVAWPSGRGDSAQTGRHASVAPGAPASRPEPKALGGEIKWKREKLTFGLNELAMTWPRALDDTAMLEVRTEPGKGVAETRVFRVVPGAASLRAQAWLEGGESAAVSAALHPSAGALVFTVHDVYTPRPGERPILESMFEVGRVEGVPERGRAIWRMFAQEANFLEAEAHRAAFESDYANAARKMNVAHSLLQQAIIQKQAISTTDPSAPFIAYQDANPWDDFDPALEGPSGPTEPGVTVEAFGNEFESVALTIRNLSDETLDLRATFAKPDLAGGFGVPKEDPLSDHITLRRAVPVAKAGPLGPFEYGPDGQPFTPRTRAVFDALPEMDRSQSLTVPAGEARQIWLVVNTKNLEPGAHNAVLYLGALGGENFVQEVPVAITVWPVHLPEGGPARMNWSRVDLDTVPDQQLQDMIDHGISVVYGPSLPAIMLDYEANVIDEGDWAAVKATLDRLPDYFQVYFHAPPSRGWKDGVAPENGSDLDNAGFRAAVTLLTRKMAEFGWGYERWALYPYDEPWNTGETLLPGLRAFCENVRAADPKVRLYTDPTGGMNAERIDGFKDLIDIWQPEVNILKRDPELVQWMRDNAGEFLAYEATDPGKNLKPLGYYRAWGWFADHFGLDGWGWWVYRYEDTWWAHAGGDWTVVYPNRGESVPSRRWEAARDGVEDYKVLKLLAAAIETMPETQAAEAKALRDEAVHALAVWQIGPIDEITRSTRPYDTDFAVLQDYRRRIAEILIEAAAP